MFGELQSFANLAKYPANRVPMLRPARDSQDISRKASRAFRPALRRVPADARSCFAASTDLSRSTAPVMILGESGSGKELVATTLHQLSARKDRPFIAVNCGAIPGDPDRKRTVRP